MRRVVVYFSVVVASIVLMVGCGQKELDKMAAIDVARRYVTACNSQDQREATITSFFSSQAPSSVSEGFLWDNTRPSYSLEGVTYELKTVDEITSFKPQKEWEDSPLIWVKVTSPFDPNGLHILFIGENGEWKIVNMF